MLGFDRYLLGVLELAALVGFATLAAARLRARLAPGFSGAPRHLATAILAISLLVMAAEALGTFGAFEPIPYLAAMALVGLAAWLALPPPAHRSPAGPSEPADRAGTAMKLAAIGFAALAIAHFSIGVRIRLGTGMTGFDSTWYHGPFAAGFFQSGDTFGLHFIAPQFLAWLYPQTSELLHAVGMLCFSRDLLSPLLNLGWLVGCLVAAWAIGRPFGAAPAAMAGAAVALDAGALADQAGEARNDLAALFFLLAAVALALHAARGTDGREGRLPAVGPLVPAGLAAGLAAGTKLNFLLPSAVLVVGLALLAPAGARRRAFAAVAGPALLAGGYWYLRNLAHTGNPLPWVRHLGPLSLPAPEQALGGREAHSVAHYLGDGSVWSDWFLPGLHHGFGALWPLLPAAAAAGLLLCLGRRSSAPLRLAAAVGLAALAAWLLAPTSASGPEGAPRGFESGLRYLAPALALGLTLLPLAPVLRGSRARWALLALLALLLAFVDASGVGWASGYLPGAVAVGLLAAAAGIACAAAPLRAAPRPARAALAVAAVAVAVAAGQWEQRSYLRNRYADSHFSAPGLDAAFRRLRAVSGARIATSGTRQYPLFGTDLSNRVQFVGLKRPHGGFVAAPTCRAWRRAIDAGRFDYVVATRDRIEPGRTPYPAQARWTESPSARVILKRPPTVVFSLRGPLDPSRCP